MTNASQAVTGTLTSSAFGQTVASTGASSSASTTDGNNHTITITYDTLDRKSSIAYPDSTSESWTYDASSHPLSHTDGKGQTIGYAYDDAGKLTTETYPGNSGAGTGVSYTYDVAGRKTGMTDVTGTTGYGYDNANRLTSLQQPNGTVTYAYDNANRKTGMTAAGVAGGWTYGYDNANRLLTTTNPYSEVATNAYDAANRLTSTTNGNASVTSYGYDNANRTTDVWHKTGAGATLAHYGYAYNAGGDVTSRTDSDGTTTTFGYDASDQLTSEARQGGYTVGYTYDHNHNRLSKTTNGSTDTYTYDAHDKLLSAGSKSYAYDSNGNCTSVTVGASVTHLAYDVENRVTSLTLPNNTTDSFAYNGLDLRTQKVDSGGTRNYVTDGSSPASDVLSDGAAVYTPGLSEHRGGSSKFYHADALGSTRGITDAGQNVTDTQLYDAFGNSVSRTGTTPSSFGFVGASQYQTDLDSSLQLLGHRYYDPSIGRFLSSDPAKAGTNWYDYCDNNPLSKTDPEGLTPPPGFYDTPLDAARAAFGEAMGRANQIDREIGGWIVRVGDYYQPIYRGTGSATGFTPGRQPGNAAGTWHTHQNHNPGWPPDTDSLDQNMADTTGVIGYAGSSDGSISINDPRPGHGNDNSPGDNFIGHFPITVGHPYHGPDQPHIGPGEVIGRSQIWRLPYIPSIIF